jgi:hypothetical protein
MMLCQARMRGDGLRADGTHRRQGERCERAAHWIMRVLSGKGWSFDMETCYRHGRMLERELRGRGATVEMIAVRRTKRGGKAKKNRAGIDLRKLQEGRSVPRPPVR